MHAQATDEELLRVHTQSHLDMVRYWGMGREVLGCEEVWDRVWKCGETLWVWGLGSPYVDIWLSGPP